MSTFNVATRYAKALVKLAEEKKVFSSVSEDAELVFNTVSASKELRNVLVSPIIKSDKKKDILTDIFSGKISSDTLEFIHFLVKKGREDLILDVFSRFLELRNEELGQVNIGITSASELNDKQKQQMESVLANYTKKQVNLDYNINNELIGGFVARMGDSVIDASVQNQLKILKKKLLV